MSELNAEFVKRGYWINLSHGKIMGQTITTDTNTGAIVIALLAVSTALAVSHLWNIVTFIYHQVRADGRPTDGLFRQQQALLRTMPTPSAMMVDSLKLLITWKGTPSSKKSLWQSSLQIVVALVFTVASVASSIFSSYVVDSSNIEVIVRSPYCGLYGDGDFQGYDSESYSIKVLAASTLYADECYQAGNIIPTRCNIFTQARVPMTIERVACPFDESMCTSPALAIDSGLLDFNNAFGLNLENDDRMKFRKRTTCVILSQDNRSTITNASDMPETMIGRPPLSGEELLNYHYGTRAEDSKWANFTWGVSLAKNNISRDFGLLGIPYRTNWEHKAIQFIPELVREDADTIISSTTKGTITYGAPIDDPWFSAHQEVTLLDISNNQNRTMYTSDTVATVVGCAEQFQYCVANKTTGEYCTGLGGLPEMVSSETFPQANDLQISMLQLLATAGNMFTISYMKNLNASSLVSRSGLIDDLPDNQWEIELKRWEAIIWTSYQTMISDYAVGPMVRDALSEPSYNRPPKTEGGRALCATQKMRKAGGFVNINFFALIFILTFAVVITIIDILLLRFLIYMSKFQRALSPRINRWVQDGVFQLQRRAYEAQDDGIWMLQDKEIPVIIDDSKLEDLVNETPRTRTQTFGSTESSGGINEDLKKPNMLVTTRRSTDNTLCSPESDKERPVLLQD